MSLNNNLHIQHFFYIKNSKKIFTSTYKIILFRFKVSSFGKRNSKKKKEFTLECSFDWGATCSQNRKAQVSTLYSYTSLFSCFLVHERKRQWNYRNYREGGRVGNGKHGKHGDSSRKRSPRRSKGESHEISKNTELPAKTLLARLLFPCHRAPESLSPPLSLGGEDRSKFRTLLPTPAGISSFHLSFSKFPSLKGRGFFLILSLFEKLSFCFFWI